MQLFIIHFLILPIKKFKKQKLKIIFFNFLNKASLTPISISFVTVYLITKGTLERSRVHI